MPSLFESLMAIADGREADPAKIRAAALVASYEVRGLRKALGRVVTSCWQRDFVKAEEIARNALAAERVP